MFKKILLAFALAIPMFAAAQTVKLAVVDAQGIVPELPAYKTAMSELEALDKKYKEEYNKYMAEGQKKFEEFQNLAKDTPDAIKERKAKELDEFQVKLAEFQNSYQEDMNKQQQAKLAPIMNTVMEAIQAVGKEGGYTLIQESAAVLYYGAPAENITPKVKARLGLK